MNKPRSKLGRRKPLNCRVSPETDTAIRSQADELGISQSEVVDRWGQVYAAALAFVQATNEIETKAAYLMLVQELVK